MAYSLYSVKLQLYTLVKKAVVEEHKIQNMQN